jgi:hypothetical protein
MIDATTQTSSGRRAARPAAIPALAIGLLGGFALGVIARAWMRLISEDPRFTWTGTISIVGGFTLFGLTQSIVAVARRRTTRWWRLTGVRTIGAVGMIPLFLAAGGLMFPTVIGCGLASARPEWPKAGRVLCLVVAAGPVLFVGIDLIGSFGWSMHTLAGFVMMLGVYATIIWATRFTLAAQHADSPAPPRARMTISLVAALLFLIALVAGGGIK